MDSTRAARETVAAPVATPTPTPASRPLPPPGESRRRGTVWVTTPGGRFGFSTVGGQLVVAELLKYKSFARADSGGPVQLIPAYRPVLATRLVAGNDTVALSDWSFVPSAPALQVDREHTRLTFSADRQGAHVTIEYVFDPDGYRFEAIER